MIPQPPFTKLSLKITYLKLNLNLPGANELMIENLWMHNFMLDNVTLTPLPLVPQKCVSESGQHWFRWWCVAYSAPSHYLSQCWLIVNWTLRNKLQWNFNQNTKIFIHENAPENIVCEMVAIFSGGYELSIHNTDSIPVVAIHACYASGAEALCFRVVRPSVRPSVCPSVRPSEAWNTLFWPVHGSVGPPDQP